MKDEGGLPELSAIAEQLLSSPELLRMLGSWLSSATKSTSPAPPPTTGEEEEDALKMGAEPASDLAQPIYSERHGSITRRHELLCALKPYVSAERARAIDSIEALARVLDILRQDV